MKISIDSKIGGRHLGGSCQHDIASWAAGGEPVSPYSSPRWLALSLRGMPVPTPTSSALALMEMGNITERANLRLACEKLSLSLDKDEDEILSQTFIKNDLPFLVGNVDGIKQSTLLEAKYSVFGWHDVPHAHSLQMNWYAGLAKEEGCVIEHIYLSQLTATGRHTLHPHLFDKDLFKEQVKNSKRFWERFVEDKEGPLPEITSSKKDEELLKFQHGKIRDEEILSPDPKMERLLTEYNCKLMDELALSRKGGGSDLLKNQIKDLLGERTKYISPIWGPITWAQNKDSITLFSYKEAKKVLIEVLGNDKGQEILKVLSKKRKGARPLKLGKAGGT